MVAILILTRTFAISALLVGAFPTVFAAPILPRDCGTGDFENCDRRTQPALDGVFERGHGAFTGIVPAAPLVLRGCGKAGAEDCDRRDIELALDLIARRGYGGLDNGYRELIERTDDDENFLAAVPLETREAEQRSCGTESGCYREVAERTPSLDEDRRSASV